MPPVPIHIEDPITPVKGQGPTPQTQADTQPPPFVNATTTATPTSSYAPARPGAAAVPAPTTAAPKPIPQATRTYNPPELSDPPAPQPGAAPVANTGAFQANATAPPRPGAHLLDQTQAHPRSATLTYAAPPTVPSVSSHPPGYQQNVYAQELSSQQRASLDYQEAREREDGNVFGGLGTGSNTNETAENVWESVKALGSKAGESAAKVHGEVWKWIDGKK